jgi:putative ABC transport system substrate-binding protein
MRRREFVARLAGATLAWPLAARAQRTIPFVGFLNSGSPNERAHLVEAFRQGLKDGGYVDGKDVAIEYRWAEGRLDRLPSLATELVKRKVAVIIATGGNAPALAAQAATSDIPIVFTGGGDPVKLGLVKALSRPGGNVTGVANIASSLTAKRLQILHDLLPNVRTVCFLVNPEAPEAAASMKEAEAAAEASTMKLRFLFARNESEIDAAFATMKQHQVNALVVMATQPFNTRREQVVALAAKHAIPASYAFREFALAGGLLSYGPDLADGYRLAGAYAARILKGAKPADMPVIQATKIELIVNLKTAKKLGLAISRDFLARVDEVIQ